MLRFFGKSSCLNVNTFKAVFHNKGQLKPLLTLTQMIYSIGKETRSAPLPVRKKVEVPLHIKKQLALGSRGRVDCSQSEVPRFDPHVCQKHCTTS